MGFANHSGSSHRIYESSCSAFLARNAQSTPSTGEGARSGNERTISQKSHSSSPNPHPIKQGIHKFYIHSPQKRWGEPPSYKFKTTKSVLNLRTFQNGGNPYVERSSKTKRLSCKDRPQGRLPNCADLERSSEIPSISVEGNTARICLPPLWVSHSPQGVHKVDETGSSGFKTTGYSSNNLPRRHTNYGRIGSLSITPCSFNSEPPGGSGIYSQLQQVPVNPMPEYRVFGFSDQFNQSHPPVARGETQENPKDLPRYSRKDRNFGSRVIKIPGPPNLFHPGHFPRPPPLPTSSKAEEHYNDLRAIVRGHINTRFSSPRGSSVVARPPSRVEWQSAIPTPNRPYNRDRCLSKGLGGILRRGQHWRPMVFRGEKTTHQLSRATRRVVCNQNIHKDHSMCTCETIDGQCSSSCIYKQNGGYSFTCFSQSSNCPVGVVSRESTDSVSSTPPGKIKHTSRQGIEDFNRLERLETQSQPISSNIENMGPTRNRSLCITSDISASSLCQLEARSSSHTDRCIHNELAKNPRVCLPAIRLNRPMLTVGHVSESRTINSNISSLASSALVPTTTPTVYRSSHSAPSISRSLNERQPATSSEQPPAGWLETVCQRFETTNVSAETREILLAAWRRNTTSAYSSAWSKWVGWCSERKINPVSVSLNAILEFLKDQFKDGKAYRTINVYRSALSAVLPEIDATSVGAHPLVCQLLKGIFHLRPPEPKYSHTWSVSQVLTYIKSLGNNEGLSLKLLSLKLVTLLALTAPDRSSDLAKKDLRFRVYYPEGVSFRLPGLSKTSKPGDSPKSSFHASFGEDKDLCPVSCLKCYETNTKEFRSCLTLALIIPSHLRH